MSRLPTSLILTPTWPVKELDVAGVSPSVHEQVAITLIDGATAEGGIPPGLFLRVHSSGNNSEVRRQPWHPLYDPTLTSAPIEFARFPLLASDVWVLSGTSLTCTLNLDTVALGAVFKDRPYNADVEAIVVVESAEDENLCAIGQIRIRNWIINTEDPVQGSSVLKTRVDALVAALDNEAIARAAADDAEAVERVLTDSVLTGRINESATAANLSQEIADRGAADLVETQNRTAADIALQNFFSGAIADVHAMAERAAAVTDLMQDGLTIEQVTDETDQETIRGIINQLVALTNLWRQQ